jgi:hypothetical protein
VKRFLTAVVLFLLALVAVYALFIRPWHVKWGATDAEAAASLPGDSLVSHPKISATHAITVQGSAADVWPWLVQIGQGRAGFYEASWGFFLQPIDAHTTRLIVCCVVWEAPCKGAGNLAVGNAHGPPPEGSGPQGGPSDRRN